jgi:hypothetical protein
MSSNQLSLDDLVRGLEHFGARYKALDVFARDIKELVRAAREDRLGDLHPVQGEPAFVFERGGHRYKLRFHPLGIARLTRAKDEPPGPADPPVAQGLLAPHFGATALDNALPAAVLGFLVGDTLGDAADAPRRVFTMTFDPISGEWHAYGGPLAKLLREKRREAEATLGSES